MILGILQARTTSSRLPQKVLRPILGRPMLARQIERLRRSHAIDKLIVATSTHPTDDPIQSLCEEENIECFRGKLNDVLDRFYQGAQQWKPQHIVRLTGDCPLTDPSLLDQITQFHLQEEADYTSNTLDPTFPEGLDVEVFRSSCLEQAWKEATLPSEREHVTPFITKHPERFKLINFKNTKNLSHLRWSVDEPLDFEVVTRIYEALYTKNSNFSTQDVLAYLQKHKEIVELNAHYVRNEGYLKSLTKDLER
ncbi:MAG: glycosyltransferase family protein [Candidatus Omnitrophica bacterium]|nr:glycosyltransferase family protein [Candidatus Omnitrophota bacterium]